MRSSIVSLFKRQWTTFIRSQSLYFCPGNNIKSSHLNGQSRQYFCDVKSKLIRKPLNSDTIYAISSGVTTAISIIRVSGPESYRVLQLMSARHQIKYSENGRLTIPPRQAILRKLYTQDNKLIDTCILLYFPQNKSYNNEEIFQLHVHGSQAVISLIFNQLQKKGLRMADRGQFTKRAVLNNKISLREAEAIDDLIKSENQFQRQVAITNMLGKGNDFLKSLKQRMIKVLVNNQAYIDFQQDQSDVKDDLFDRNKQEVSQLIKQIDRLIDNYKNLQVVKDGINIAIIGRPNVGKSTLINSLSKKEISIVSNEPGTTRDIVQTTIESNGVAIHLYDTAGLRESPNKIQNEGIKRAKQKMKESHYRLLLLDINQQIVHTSRNNNIEVELADNFTDDISNQSECETMSKIIMDPKTLLIINKADMIPAQKSNKKIFLKLENPSQSAQTLYKQASYILCSENEEQVSQFLKQIGQIIAQQYPIYVDGQQSQEKIYFTRQRYFNKLSNCREMLELYQHEDRIDIACEYLRSSINEISEIFGRVDAEDVLDVLFKEFCIGK